MIIARCPACQTVFRARPEQLSAHGGRVRCGHCLKAFNALDNVVLDEQDPAISNIDEETGFDEPAEHAQGERHPNTFERMADRLDFIVPDEFLPSRATSSEERAATSDLHTSSLNGITDDISRMEGMSRLSLPVAALADASITQKADADTSPVEDEKAPPFGTRERSVKEDTARMPSEIGSPGSSVIRRRAPQLAIAVAPEVPSPGLTDEVQDESSNVRRYGDTQASPGSRWLMGLAIGILLGTLSAQVAYNFRVEITRNWPQLRPIYLELCAQLGCELPLPRVATAIRITSSNLESDLTEPTRFVLNASITNQARHPLAFPYLELTLTDARDRSIVRRVLGPEEWARGADTSKGLASGEEIETSLAFSAPDLTNATGYRVYAFYP